MAAQFDLNNLVAFRGQLDQWVAEVGPAGPDAEDLANARPINSVERQSSRRSRPRRTTPNMLASD